MFQRSKSTNMLGPILINLEPAVNRQPGYRREDSESIFFRKEMSLKTQVFYYYYYFTCVSKSIRNTFKNIIYVFFFEVLSFLENLSKKVPKVVLKSDLTIWVCMPRCLPLKPSFCMHHLILSCEHRKNCFSSNECSE